MATFNQSKIKMFRRCQKQFSFMVDYAEEGLELKPKRPKLPLKIGSWLHSLQEAYHRDLARQAGFDIESPGWKEVHAELSKGFESMFDEEKEVYGELPDEAFRLFTAYLRHWSSHGDAERFTVAALHNGEPGIEFVIEVPLAKGHVFKGRIDLMVEDHEYGGLWVRDGKWVKSLPKPDERMMSPQALMYVWGLRKLGYPVRGFVFDFGRKKPPTIPPLLKKGMLTTRHSLDTDVYTYVREIKRTHGDDWKQLARTYYREKIQELKARHNDWFRRERVPVEDTRIATALGEFRSTARDILRRTTEDVPRTYLYSCPFQCDYHDLCVAEFNGLDIEGLLKANYTEEPERYTEEVVLD